ncbi:MAG: hypothetical protein E6G76_10565 [Alphaproteobacteria bacterium]|nr:MAG: hypothetical protein E6G76_10565 [Alphaproteobacteria bacterium]
MPALVAGIHVLLTRGREDVDGRDKPGHDAYGMSSNAPCRPMTPSFDGTWTSRHARGSDLSRSRSCRRGR